LNNCGNRIRSQRKTHFLGLSLCALCALCGKIIAVFAGGQSVGDRAKEKVALARRLRQETTMTLNRIAERLNPGAAGSLANLLRDTEWRR
jgi:hypothetical protein